MYTVAPGRAELTELIRASTCMLIVAVAIWAMFIVPLRNIARAAVLTTVAILLITLVTPGVMDGIDRSWLGDIGMTRRRYVMTMFGTVLLFVALGSTACGARSDRSPRP